MSFVPHIRISSATGSLRIAWVKRPQGLAYTVNQRGADDTSYTLSRENPAKDQGIATGDFAQEGNKERPADSFAKHRNADDNAVRLDAAR